MGTGHSADTPIRVAFLGITSVISLVDDILLERIRKYYNEKYKLPYSNISLNEEDGRAKRITAYLETVKKIVQIKMDDIKSLPFFENNDKKLYFDLLPDQTVIKQNYNKLLNMKNSSERNALAENLTQRMLPGSIDVNIMVKLDRVNLNDDGSPVDAEFSDAKTAFRGFAKSSLQSCIVFSAGLNNSLFNYITKFKDFYRDKTGEIKKKIILKVSDFRSALIQGKFLAKKGLEIHEFRIESGLNCGGHAFASKGILLPAVLKDFKENRDKLTPQFLPLIKKYYKKMGLQYPKSAENKRPLITVQGGIGVNGESLRLMEEFGMDLTGWATPFLLVPEATCVDTSTLGILQKAGERECYLSDVSPLEIPFNNVRGIGSEVWICKKVAEGKPGSACKKGFLISNTEFTKLPICLASKQYQKKKLKEIDEMQILSDRKENLRQKIVEKACICDHLGNGALIALGIVKEKNHPQSICPGPNIAWFDRIYTLREMVDHIYGKIPSVISSKRPHMFAKEIAMYVDYFEKQVADNVHVTRGIKYLQDFKTNLEKGMKFCLDIAKQQAYPEENLASIPICVEKQGRRLQSIYENLILDIARSES